MKKLLLALFAMILWAGSSWGQTTLISPTGAGGFENGSNLVDNGWTAVNSVQSFFVGSFDPPGVSAGTNCAYTSTTAGSWTPGSAGSVAHIYRDITVPVGEPNISISLRYKTLAIDATYDYLRIHIVPTTTTPVAGTALTTGQVAQIDGTTSYATYSYFTTVTAGSTVRFVISFRQDGYSPYGAAAIDEISLTSEAPPAPLTGIKTIKTSGGDYASFTAAINAMNIAGIGTGGVTFNVDADFVSTENCPAITATGTASNQIIFQKNGIGANPKIIPTGTAGTSDAGIVISGGDYITFDGIDIDASAVTAVEYGYLIRNAAATNGAQYNTIKNCTVTLNRGSNSASSSSSGIFQTTSSTGGGITPTSAAGANSYNKYYNLTIQSALNGVYLSGHGTYRDLSCEIGTTSGSIRNSISNLGPTSNTFTSARGIYVFQQEGVRVFNNDIISIAADQAASYGIYFTACYGTANEVNNNKIQNISVKGSTSTTSSAYGMRADLPISGTHNVRIYNNFISNIYTSFTGTATISRYVYGLFIGIASATSSQSYDVDNNSVSIGQGLTPTYSNTCFELQNGSPVLRFRGNVFANFTNAQTGVAKHFCAIVTAAGVGATGSAFDYNDYYIANSQGTSGHVGRNGSTSTNYNTISDWKGFTTGTLDETSFSNDPSFLNNNTDLHASAAALNAVSGFSTQSWITTDIDNETRSTVSPSDVGADAFNLASCTMPTGLTANNITYISADVSWTAPGTGTPNGYEWEVRSSGAGGSGATGLVASGSTTHPTVAASVTGLSGGTTYTLYVRTFCGGSDYSTWASNTFSTLNCNLPTGVVVSSITASSATLTWVAPVSGSPEGYEWEVRSSGAAGSGSTGLAASGSTTSPVVTANASGLVSATSYSVYVRSMCYSGFYSGWTTAVLFNTQCNAEPAPTVVQDFTTYTGTAPAPVCWSEATGALAASSTLTYGSSEWFNSTGFANTGTNKGVKVNLYSTGSDWIISQPIDLGSTAGLYRVKYRMAVTGYNSTTAQSTLGTHKVDVVVSTDGGSTWSNANVIKTYTGAGSYSNTGQDETINLTAYSGVVKIAFVETTSASSPDIDFHIDDFVVEALPSCVEPSALNTSGVTLNSASLNWTASVSSPSGGYEYEVRTSGAGGSGATGLILSGNVAAGVTTVNVTGLSANTSYSFYVRANCGSGFFSSWAGPSSFFTGYCTPAPSSVDGSGITRVVFSSVNNPTGAEPGNYGNYTALVGNVGQGLLIPVDITFATGFTYDTKIWIDWNDDLDFNDSGEEVYTGTSLSTNPTTLNASFTVPVSAPLGNHRMRIGGVDSGPPTVCYTGSYGSYEDYTVNVILPPSCLPPTSLTASNLAPIGADLSWASPDSFFDIYIEVYGSPAPGAGTTPTIDDNSGNTYTWKDGSPATRYQFYVRSDCGQNNTDVSDWAGPVEFTTLCAVASTPFIETAEGSLTCWAVSGGTYNWAVSGSASGYGSGSKSFIANFYGINNTTPFYLFSPEFDAGTLTNPVLEFDYAYAAYSGGEVDEMNIYTSTDGGATSTLLLSMPGGVNGILNTAGIVTGSFVPNAAQWATRAITLPAGTNMVIFGAISDFGNNLYIDNIEIKDATATATWSGTANSQWYVATNWTPSVPGSATNVIIPGGLANYPTLTTAASCNNFTVLSGGSFIGSELLTVNGTATVERSIDAYSSETASDGWHLVSSPVANQAITGPWTPATGYDFYALNESVAEYWVNQKNHPEMTSFVPGKGYLVAYEVAGTKTFSGALNSGPVTLSGLTNTPGAYAGSHLVGNPFTSAVNSASFTRTNVAANVQVWNSANAAYEVAATIPALNGFMVYTDGSGELTIPLAARTHSGPAWFKSGNEAMIILKANDLQRNMAQKSMVRFDAQATTSFDMEYDAYFLAGFAPMFYSTSGEEGFALNTLPELTNETVIPFNFIRNESTEFNIELVQSVPGAILYLTDKKTNKVVNLTETPSYAFTAMEGDMDDRFLLTFGAVGIEDPATSSVNIYGYRDLVYISGAAGGSEVRITNLLGQEMARTLVKGSELNTISAAGLANGVYVVSVISGSEMISRKVVIER